MRFFSVKGSGNFPFEMLYHSQAWPSTSDEAEKISLACPTQAREQTIVLATQHDISGTNQELWRRKKWPIQRIY